MALSEPFMLSLKMSNQWVPLMPSLIHDLLHVWRAKA